MTLRHLIPATIALAILAGLSTSRFAQAQSSPAPQPSGILRMYIPSGRLDAVATKDRPGALLPLDEFEALLKEAQAKAATIQDSPRGSVILRADYAAEIRKEYLAITARVRVRSFEAGWQLLTLPVSGLQVLSARFEGDEAQPILSRIPSKLDQLRLILAEPGEKTLVLELSAPLSAAGGDAAARFGLIGAPQGELTLTLPAGKRLRVDGAMPERPAADDQPAEYRVAIGARQELRLVITDRKAIDRTDAMTFASTTFGVLASPGEATWVARTQLSVFGRPLDKLECEVPSSLEITDVESQGLEAWQLSDGAAGKTKISLTWRQPFDGLRPITFKGVFSPDRGGVWRIPSLTLQNVSSHTGTLLLERPAGVRLQITQTSGVRPVAAASTQPVQDGNSGSQFDLWREDFQLEFVPATREREVQAAMSTLVSLGPQGADLMTTIDLETRFAPLFEVDIVIPSAWQVVAATAAGVNTRWQLINDEGGRSRVRIPLSSPLKPGENRAFSLAAHFEPPGWPVAGAPVRMPLPEVRLPQAGVIEALYGVTADSDLEVIPVDIQGLTPARQSDVDTLNRQLAAFQKTVRLGFTYQDSVFQGQLEIRRLPARLTSTLVLLSRIDAQAVATHFEAQLAIGGGGVRELQVRLAESAGRDLRFRLTHSHPQPLFSPPRPVPQAVVWAPPLPIVLEQKAGPTENGMILWTIKLDRYARGNFALQAELSQPRAAAAPGESPKWNVPVAMVVGAEQESGAIGIEAADDQHITADARDSANQLLERVDPIDFPPAHAPPRERLVAAFAFDRPGWNVTLAEQRLDRIAMPTAVVHALSMQSIVGAEGVRQVEADATLSAVGIQSLLLRLPPDHHLWAALVDGAPVEVHKSGESLSIPLTPVDPPSRERQVRLLYAPADDAVRREERLGGFSIRESPPQFSVVTGQGVEQPVTVLSSTWTLHHAADLEVVQADGVFQPAAPFRRDSLVNHLLTMFRLPNGDDAIGRVAILGAIFVVLWLFSTAQRKLPKVFLGCLVLMVLVPVAGLMLLALPRAANVAYKTSKSWDATPAPTSAPAVGLRKSLADPKPMSPASDQEDFLGLQRKELAADGLRRQSGVYFDQVEAGKPLDSKKEGKDTDKPTLPVPGKPAARPAPKAKEDADRDQLSLAITAPAPQSPQPPPAPAEPVVEAEQIDRIIVNRSKRQLARGEGLLSVAFALHPPAGSEATRVASTSDHLGNESNALSIRFVDTRTRTLWMAAMASGCALAGWWMRTAGLPTRLIFLLATLLSPFSLRWVVPVAWLPLLDGAFIGGLAAVGLWCLFGVYRLVASCPCWKSKCGMTRSAAAVLLLMGLGTGTPANAQPPAAKSAPPGRPVPAVTPPEAVFIPYDNPLEPLSAKNVFVPQDLFLKLWRTAHPDQAPPVKPPFPAVVSAAGFVVDLAAVDVPSLVQGRPGTASVPLQGRLVLNNLTTGATQLALPLKGIAVTSARINGSDAILESKADGSLSVTLPESGVSVLDLSFQIPMELTALSGKFRWQSEPVPAGLLTLKLPVKESIPELRAAGSKIAPLPAAVEGIAVWEIPIDRGGAIDFSWQPAAAQNGQDSPIHVQTVTRVSVDDPGLTTTSSYTVRVSQGGMNELTLSFPGSARLKRIEGADIAGWRIDGENAGRKLVVFFARKIDSQTVFSVEAFQPAAISEQPQPLMVNSPQPEGVARETGKIGVFAAPHLDVRQGNMTGLAQDDLKNFASSASNESAPANPLQLAYRYAARPIGLELIVQRRQAETTATAQHGVFLLQRKLRVSTHLEVQVVQAPIASMTVSLPPGYLLLDATGRFVADYVVSNGDGGRRILTVELDQPRTGRVDLYLNGTVERKPEETSALILTPRLLNVARVESQLGVWVDDLYTATVDAMGDWKNADPSSLTEGLRQLRPVAMQFGFRTASVDPQPATIGLRAQSAELSADVLTLIAVSNTSLDYGLTMQWRIRRAATDTFSFTGPAWLRGRLDLAGQGIRQILTTDLPGDRVKWTISLTDPVRETYLLTAAASLPTAADGRVVAPEIVFESAGSAGAATRLEAQRQYAVVVNLSRRPLAMEDPASAELIRREALPLKVPDALVRQAMSIVQLLPGRAPVWLARRADSQSSLQATVTGARLETVVDVDGSWRTKASYTIRNRGRQFLPVDLSEMGDVRVLSILVKDQPARALESTIGGRKIHLVPLPPSSAADLSYSVTVMLGGQLSNPLPRGGSVTSLTLELPAPHITTPTESSEFGLPVAQTVWSVRLPDGVTAEVDEAGNLTPHQAAEWALLADAQELAKLEGDAEEMLRIVNDSTASDQRKVQAWFNLNILSSEISGNQLRFDSYSNSSTQILDEKAAETTRLNSARGAALKQRVDVQLQQNAITRGVAVQTPTPTPAVAVPQLQGSLDLKLPAVQAGEGNASNKGRAYILDNSLQILNSNGEYGLIAREKAAEEFRFRAADAPADPVGEKSPQQNDRPTSRSGLQRRLSEQKQSLDDVQSLNQVADPQQSHLWANQPMAGGGGIGGGMPGGMAGGFGGSTAPGSGWVPVVSSFSVGFEKANGAAGPQSSQGTQLAGGPAPGWTAGAGLSLAMVLPPTGDGALAFSKVGGNPRLVLSVSSREAAQATWGWVEFAISFVVGVWLIAMATSWKRFGRAASLLIAVASAAGFLLLPGAERWLALGVFAVAAATVAITAPRPRDAAAAPTGSAR